MQKFLLVSARPGAAQQAAEYRDFLVNTGLNRAQLDHVCLDSETSMMPELDNYAGILLGGSPFNVTTENPSDVQLHVESELLKAAKSATPALFVCFGNSLLGKHCGGRVEKKFAEEAGITWVELTSAARQDPLLRGLPLRFSSLTGHTESVVELPTGATLLATGPSCPVQMFRLSDDVWSCQFHADMDIEAMLIRMEFYRDNGYFDPEEFEAVAAAVRLVETRFANQILQNFVTYCRQRSSKLLLASA
ncbi:glutamine amidotransferase [Corynebacterium epidermidicanis]|uniref:GMP synthase family protein n=1 Tax=Corynebacterium epidermidicanis TaxID=1050174 RepID=A0A0G3GWI1_9CORY|nr:glutamine amidotransferase [Corynebacterium epidermidicanis]AKK03182.1 GMP synthase family protein [Corynebacterium epidermidicanis]